MKEHYADIYNCICNAENCLENAVNYGDSGYWLDASRRWIDYAEFYFINEYNKKGGKMLRTRKRIDSVKELISDISKMF